MRFDAHSVFIHYHYGSIALHDDNRCLALHHNNFAFGCCLDGSYVLLDGSCILLDGIPICINWITVSIDINRALHDHWTGSSPIDGMIDNCSDGCTKDERAEAAMIEGGRSIVNISVVRTAVVASVVAVVTRLCENGSCGEGYYQYEGQKDLLHCLISF